MPHRRIGKNSDHILFIADRPKAPLRYPRLVQHMSHGQKLFPFDRIITTVEYVPRNISQKPAHGDRSSYRNHAKPGIRREGVRQ